MRTFLTKVVVNALAVWVASLVIDSVGVPPGTSTSTTVLTLLVVGLIFGVVNAVIKPIVKLFTLPFYLLTLGLFAFVVNALMLKLVDWLSGALGIAFSAGDSFWATLGAAVVVTFVSLALNIVLPDKVKA